MQDLIMYMLEQEPSERGSAFDILEHPWLMVSIQPRRNNEDNLDHSKLTMVETFSK